MYSLVTAVSRTFRKTDGVDEVRRSEAEKMSRTLAVGHGAAADFRRQRPETIHRKNTADAFRETAPSDSVGPG